MTTTQQPTDQFAWWRGALERVAKGHPIDDIHESNPEPGFYRVAVDKDQNGTKTLMPVAFWHDKEHGHLRCAYDGKEVQDDEKILRIWVRCAKTPITQDVYKARRQTGQWPDAVPTATSDGAQRSNAPSDPFEAIKAEIMDLAEQADSWLAKTVIDSKVLADKARNWEATFQALWKRADGMRETEKEPFLEGGRAVDAKFKPLLTTADTSKKGLKMAYEKWAVSEEARLKAEAQAKYEMERKAAEAARAEIEAQRAKKLADDPVAALTDPEPEMPEIPAGPEPVKVQVGGGTGSRAGLTTHWEPHIVDWKACLAHYADHPNVRAVVEKLVAAETKLHKDATKIPGVDVKAVRKAK